MIAPLPSTASPDGQPQPAGNPRKAFTGLAHLPDGPHRRKVQKTKNELIHKAKVRNTYAKLRAREPPRPPLVTTTAYDPSKAEPASLAPHPSRAHPIEGEDLASTTLPTASASLGSGPASPAQNPMSPARSPSLTRPARASASPPPTGLEGSATPARTRLKAPPRPAPFARETRIAAQRKEEAEKRAERRARAEAERAQKLAERERRHRAWRKAKRPDKDGKRRLGRESKLLLEKVQRLVGAG